MKKKVATIELQGNEYARVQTRLQEFREDNPRGLVETKPKVMDGGQVIFKARILKDKKEASSAEATGHAMGTAKGKKDFEKLETIAVGRALAMLGYSTTGEIASAEEMLEFEEYQKEQKQKKIDEATAKLEVAESLEELKKVWSSLEGSTRAEVQDLKDKRKKALVAKKAIEDENTKVPRKKRVAGSKKG